MVASSHYRERDGLQATLYLVFDWQALQLILPWLDRFICPAFYEGDKPLVIEIANWTVFSVGCTYDTVWQPAHKTQFGHLEMHLTNY